MVARGKAVAARGAVGIDMGGTAADVKRWKQELGEVATVQSRRQARLAVVEAAAAGEGRSSAVVYGAAAGVDGAGEAAMWMRLVPRAYHRVMLRRMKLGALPRSKVMLGKTEPMFQRLPADLREEFEMCQCGAGRQDARHFWEECVFLQPLRDEVEARMQELVLGGESVLSMDAWQRMTAWERLLRAVSVERFCASDVAEAQFKGWAAERWVEEGVRVMDSSWEDAGVFLAEVRAVLGGLAGVVAGT